MEDKAKQTLFEKAEFGDTGEVELPEFEPIDVSPYEGKRAKIEKVEELMSKVYNKPCIRLSTEVLASIPKQDGSGDIVIKGSRLLGLTKLPNGTIGWGKDTKMGDLLAKYKVQHYRDLVGKTVVLTSQARTVRGRKVFFLTF